MKNLKIKQIKFVDGISKIEKHTKTNCHWRWFFVGVIVICLLWAFILWDGGTLFSKPVSQKEVKELSGIWLGRVDITAYSEIDSCHNPNCVMANGQRAEIGYIACPRAIPIGTMIYIDNLAPNYFECGDRTAITYKGKHIDGRYDIFMGYGEDAYKKAVNFGVKKRDVYLIK